MAMATRVGSSWARRGLVAVAASALALALVVAPAQAAPAGGPAGDTGNVASTLVSGPVALSAGEQWTPERMASAKPLEIVVPSEPRGATPRSAPATTGPMVTVPPTPGTLPAVPTLLSTTVSRPYTDLPDRLNGKVFFTEGGDDWVCSGTVVNSNNKDMVDTAGHCVSDGAGIFHQDWIFVPAFASSATTCTTLATCAPYGVWTARALTTSAQWHYYTNYKQDFGYAVLNTLNGRHIADYLGGQGTRFNQPRAQIWAAFGYPAAPPFTGSDQERCDSDSLADDDPVPSLPGPPTIAIDCDMTGGSSGGGWLIGLSPTSGLGYVNSHNNYGYTEDPGAMYGIYYGTEIAALFDYTQSSFPQQSTPGSFVPLQPVRVLDTRTNLGAAGPVRAQASIAVQILGKGGVPSSGVSAVVVNLTVTVPTKPGNITAYPDGTAKPVTSNLNFLPGQSIPNLAIVPVGADGKIRLANNSPGTVHLIADIAGYYQSGVVTATGGFVSLPPARVLDTRSNLGVAGPVRAQASIAVQILGKGGVPTSGVSAVVVNLTVTVPTKPGNITAYPDGTATPVTSNLNFLPGQSIPNLAIVPVGADGKIRLANNSPGTVHLIADIAGYYRSGAVTAAGGFVSSVAGGFGSLGPVRILDTRSNLGVAGPVRAQATIAVQILGKGGIPTSGVSAVVVNLTVTVPTKPGNITAYPDGTAKPVTSNLNFLPGQSVPNLAIVPVGADGKIRLANNSPGTVQLIADIAGYYHM